MSALFVRSFSEAETLDIAAALSKLLQDGDSLVLCGDLGAGKTRFTKGLALGLGVTDEVVSPTFTIASVYKGSAFKLYHYDLYRLEDAHDLEDTGIFDCMGEDGVCVIEWGDRFLDVLGEPTLLIELTRMTEVSENNGREITVYGFENRGTILVLEYEVLLAQRGYQVEKSV